MNKLAQTSNRKPFFKQSQKDGCQLTSPRQFGRGGQQTKKIKSQIFKRVLEGQDGQRVPSRKNTNTLKSLGSFKMKVSRKDTSQTRPTIVDTCPRTQQERNTKTLTELYEKSKNDPFLKRKLNLMFKEDIKAIAGKNSQSNQILDSTIDKIVQKQDQLSDVVAFITDRFIDSNQISLKGEQSLVHFISDLSENSGNISNENNTSLGPVKNRMEKNFLMEEDERLTKQNREELNDKVTTFRKVNFKTILSRIETLKEISDDRSQKSDQCEHNSCVFLKQKERDTV